MELLTVIGSGVFALIGVFVGAALSTRSEAQRQRRQLLVDAYAELFSAYYFCIPDCEDTDFRRLVAAIEQTKLICSPTSHRLLNEILTRIVCPDDRDICLDLIRQLQLSAKEEIRNG